MHYCDMPMQYTVIFKAVLLENFQMKNGDLFLIFALNIDCRYMFLLELPKHGLQRRMISVDDFFFFF